MLMKYKCNMAMSGTQLSQVAICCNCLLSVNGCNQYIIFILGHVDMITNCGTQMYMHILTYCDIYLACNM